MNSIHFGPAAPRLHPRAHLSRSAARQHRPGLSRLAWLAALGVLLALLLPGRGVAAPASTARFDVLDRTLPNGLRVLVLEDFDVPVVAVQLWYHVGSKNENPQRQGFAHMFEHMMFRGTERLGPKSHFELIRKVGGDANAYTSFDTTVYVQKLPANQLELALYLEAERMAFLRIDQESFSTERSVVEEERRQGLNSPYGTVLERLLPELFREHPYRWAPIGNIPHLRQAKVDELARFWETYYVPNNATLVVVGAVKKQDVLALAERYFGWIPRGEEPPRVTVREPEQTAPREIRITEPKGPLTLVGQVYRTVPVSHPDAVALDVLADILGQGESSRLYRRIVKDEDLAVAAAAEAWALEQDGIFGFGAALKPMGGKARDAVLKVLDEEVRRVQTEGVTPEELSKAQLRLTKAAVAEAQTVEGRAELLGQYAVVVGDLERVNRRFDEIRAVTAEDVQRVARTYLVEARRNTVTVEPAGFGELLRSFVARQEDDTPPPAPVEGNPVPERQGPKAAAVRPADFPEAPPIADILKDYPAPRTVERVLPNGLKVVVVPREKLPLVTFTLGLKRGAYAESDGAFGVAEMAAGLLTQGTANFSSRELAAELENRAIDLSATVGPDVGSVTASALADQAGRAIELLAEVVRRPTFPEDEFKRLRQQALAGLAVSEQDPKFLADREFRARLFGAGHVYGRTTSSATLRSMTRDAVAAWWTTHVRPETTVLYVAGDLTPEAAFTLAERFFGDWRVDGEAPPAAVPPAPPRSATTIYLVDKPGASQSEIRIGQLALTRSDPRWQTARVLTQVFGGSFDSRLNEVIRVQKGLTYGIFGYFRPYRDAGHLEISTFSKTDTTAETVSAVLAEMARMKDDPVTDRELSIARSYLVGSFPIDRETPQDVINDLWLIEYAGLPATYLRDSLALVAATEADDVMRLAREVLDERQVVVVVVGDASKVAADLEQIAPVVRVGGPTAAGDASPDSPR
ncbi:MAG: M16 family metallopeptidase [Tepidisphaerales bacterium]